MKYSDIVGVNENFQYSVNLQFDINNIDKINQDMNVEYFEDYAHLKVIFDK